MSKMDVTYSQTADRNKPGSITMTANSESIAIGTISLSKD
jgi:hypothetical protein